MFTIPPETPCTRTRTHTHTQTFRPWHSIPSKDDLRNPKHAQQSIES